MPHDHILCTFYIKQVTVLIFDAKKTVISHFKAKKYLNLFQMNQIMSQKTETEREWCRMCTHTQNNMNICTVVFHLYLACKAINNTVLVRVDIPTKGFSCEKPFFRAAFLAESYQREGEAIDRCRKYDGKEDKGQKNVPESWERAMVWMKGEGETERVFHEGRGLLLVGGV